ncbi:MAG: glycoside hydrolase family 13 protein [Bacteroidota bacterium]|nr:glycoside hydrolase family 13 protein [Bacteroidota bacterium]
MKKIIAIIVCICFVSILSAQDSIEVYPSHWWVAMKEQKLQIMVHGKNIANQNFTLEAYPGVKFQKTNKVENPNYVFLDLNISPTAKTGILHFKTTAYSVSYELRPRRTGNGTAYAQGINQSDFMYLIMPDRFSNGDESNDKVAGYKDQSLDRSKMYDRHGGDIQGIINHLDYLQDLGVTTVWMTPILDNDMPNRTEHGYAITNHYKVDTRHGGNEAYKKLSDSLHKRGMKLIQDAVYNHCGLYNFLIQDMPMKDWVHQWPTYTNTTYKDQPLMDIHAAKSDAKIMSDGWFTKQMPDLNQGNPYVANFLIQNAIWSVEEFGVDAWRIDTYIYNDLDFMNRCNKALTVEYPKITMFGETWVHGVLNQSYFTENNLTNIKFKSNLTGTTDFQTNLYGIAPALTQNFGWTDGVNKLYQTLANDFVYKHPENQVVFLDNHDMSRFFSQVGEDVDKLKMGIGWLLTTRGIPEMYYGTEILLKGVSNPDGLVRGDFIGGWKEDAQNKFTPQGRSDKENEVFNWTKTIANFRKASSAIKAGKLMQYVPENWVYTYFRYDDKQTVLVVMNTSTDERTIRPDRISERTTGFTKAKNIVAGWTADLTVPEWKVPGKTIWVLELGK